MDNSQTQNVTKKKSKKSQFTNLRVSISTRKKINDLLSKVNKKKFGKRVKAEAVIDMALSFLDDSHLKELQEKSLTNKDRLELKYQEYLKANGNVSKDEFIGKLLGTV